MSNFLGANSGFGASTVLVATDERNLLPFMRWNVYAERTQMSPWTDGRLWSTSSFMGGAGAGTLFALTQDAGCSNCYETMSSDESGGQQALKIRGVTRDLNGNPLGSVIVRGFLTATNAFIGQCTSDSGGYYELPTPYVGAQHYLVAYQSGSPDITGSTVDTLTPS
jgi:hypothetical protein